MKIKISSIVIGYSIKTRVMSKKWQKILPPIPEGLKVNICMITFLLSGRFPMQLASLDFLCKA